MLLFYYSVLLIDHLVEATVLQHKLRGENSTGLMERSCYELSKVNVKLQ